MPPSAHTASANAHTIDAKTSQLLFIAAFLVGRFVCLAANLPCASPLQTVRARSLVQKSTPRFYSPDRGGFAED
jgi:hypothetical protein